MRKNNREKILQTARRLFLKYGYNGISMRTIAAHAKLTTGAVYFHFKNKKEIYRTICEEALDILRGMFMDSIARGTTPSQKLISTFDSYLSFFYKYLDYYNILMEYKSEFHNGESGERNEIAHRMEDLFKMIACTVDEGIKKKEFRELHPLMLVLFLAALSEGMLQFKKLGILESMKITDREFRKFMADTTWKGIRNED